MVIFRYILRPIWWGGVICLVLLALSLSVTRLLIPQVEAYRGFLEHRVGQYVAGPAEIKRLRARMRGFQPELVLQGVTVFEPTDKHPVLTFDEIRLAPDFLEFIGGNGLVARWVSLVGANIDISRAKNGTISVVGLKADDDPPEWLFEAGRLELLKSDIDWQDQKRGGEKMRFSDIDISLVNDHDNHDITASFALPPDLGKRLAVYTTFQGNLFSPRCCSGRLFLEGEGIQFANLFARQTFGNFEINRGVGRFQIWSDWKQSNLTAIYGHVDVVEPALERIAQEQNAAISFDGLRSWFRWSRNADGWSLAAIELQVKSEGVIRPSSRFAITASNSQDGDLAQLDGSFSYLRIEDVLHVLAATDLLSPQQMSRLHALGAGGELRNVALSAVDPKSGANSSALCADFDNLNFNASAQYPGVKNFSGFLCADSIQGVLKLDSKQAEFSLNSLFRGPLEIKSVSGEIDWEKNDHGWRISSERFHLASPDLTTTSRFQWDSPEPGESPFLDLRTVFQATKAEKVAAYLPAGEMDEDVVEWLDQAFLSGTLNDGQLLVHGPVNSYPFAGRDGVFKGGFQASDTILQYHKDWPRLTQLNGRVLFHGGEAVITVDSGKVSGSVIDGAVVIIPDIVDGHWLTVTGQVHGNVANSMRFLSASPLRDRVASLLKVAKFEGGNRIELDLAIPLDSGQRQVKVNGAAKLKDLSIHLDDIEMNVEGINGRLSFGANTISAKHIHGHILDAPATINLLTRGDDFHVQVSSFAEIKALKRQFPSNIWNHLAGAADYELSLKVPKQIDSGTLGADINVISNLNGIEVSLPKPLNKSKFAKTDFSLAISLKEARKTTMSFGYNQIAQGDLIFSEPNAKRFELEGGQLKIGLKSKRETITDTLEGDLDIIVDLDRLNLDSWWMFYNSNFQQSDAADFGLSSLRLETEQLSWLGRSWGPVSFNLRKKEGEWRAGLKNPFVKGRIFAPIKWSEKSSLSANFEFVKIPENDSISDDVFADTDMKPTRFPNFSVTSAHLYWRDADLGPTKLTASQHVDGLSMDSLTIESDNHQLSLTGLWSRRNSQDLTKIKGTLKLEDFGRFLQQFKITEEIRQTKADIGFDLNWKNSPFGYGLRNLNGKVTMDLGKGRILGIEPGFGRALGILNLDTWKRRLSLDFSDLYAEGFAYDKIEGVFDIQNGDAKTETLFIDGIAARIYGSGRVGLVAEDVDQVVTVVPKSTASLPIAGTIVGGPAVGAAIFFAQKLIGENVDSIASTQYTLKGTWSDPQLTRLPGRGGMLDRAWTGLKDFTGIESGTEIKKENGQ